MIWSTLCILSVVKSRYGGREEGRIFLLTTQRLIHSPWHGLGIYKIKEINNIDVTPSSIIRFNGVSPDFKTL